jgi:hypothetical protein
MRRLSAGILALAAVLMLASCDNVRDDYTDGSTEASRDRLEQVVTALNDRDADALRAMFAESAIADNGAEIDAGLDYLLTVFSAGGVTAEEKQSLPVVEQHWIDADHRAIMVGSMFRISAGGEDYQLYVADFTTNTIDPEDAGLYALGVGPRTASLDSDDEKAFYAWTATFDSDPEVPPSIYIPEPGVGAL